MPTACPGKPLSRIVWVSCARGWVDSGFAAALAPRPRGRVISEQPPESHDVENKASELQGPAQAGIEIAHLSESEHVENKHRGVNEEERNGRQYYPLAFIPESCPEKKARCQRDPEIHGLQDNRGRVGRRIQAQHVDIAEVQKAFQIEPQAGEPEDERETRIEPLCREPTEGTWCWIDGAHGEGSVSVPEIERKSVAQIANVGLDSGDRLLIGGICQDF